jgi:hypothetical protein
MLDRSEKPLTSLSWEELQNELEKAKERIEAQCLSIQSTKGRGFISQTKSQKILEYYIREKNEIACLIDEMQKHVANSNANKLMNIGYAEEIPEKFECVLMKEILTDPVYDPNHPQYKFERLVIFCALQNKKENPFTRTPLTQDSLVSDVALKNEIDGFVADIIIKHDSINTANRKSGMASSK